MSPVRVSIVIPTRNNIPYLSLCLAAVIPTLTENDEILVISNGSRDDQAITTGYINGVRNVKTRPLVRCLHTDEPGFSPACNLGLKSAKGEYVVLLNDDTIVAPNWLSTILAAEQEAKKVAPEIKWGYMGPRSNNALPIQTIKQEMFPYCNDPGGVSATANQLATLRERHTYAPASQLSGFCLVMRREALNAVGYLDSFGMGGFEDNDWCLRAQQKGFLGLLACRSFVFHFGHMTLNRVNAGHKGGTELIGPFLEKWYQPTEKKLCVSYRVKVDTEEDLEFFRSSLRATSEFADYIVVLNDHSLDPHIIDIDVEFPKIVKLEEVTEDEHGEVRDRNRLLKMARDTGADWIWNLDHDEIPDGVAREYIQQLMNPVNPSIKLYLMNLHTCWRDDQTVRADGVWHGLILRSLHAADLTYGNIHPEFGSDFHCSRGPTHMPADAIQRTFGITVKHLGYVDMQRCREKQARYRKLDTVKDPQLIGTPNYEHLTDETNIILLPYSAAKIGYLMLAKSEKLDVLSRIRQYKDSFADFVIVDTGGTDGTAEAAAGLGVKVVPFRCCDKAEEPDHLLCDFSAARNFAIEQMTTDYIFFNDPDEEITGPATMDLDKIILEGSDGFFVEIDNLNHSADGQMISYKTWQPRLFRNDPRIRYTERVHETLESSFLEYPDLRLSQTHIHIMHYGFLKTNQEERKIKNNKYAEHLVDIVKADPNNARALYALAVHLNDNKMYDQGDAMLGKALALNDDFWSARWELSLRLCRRALDLMLQAANNGKFPRDARLQPARQLIQDLIKWFPDLQSQMRQAS